MHTAIEHNTKVVLHLAVTESADWILPAELPTVSAIDRSLLVPLKMKNLDSIGKRPRDSCLNVGRAQKQFGIELLVADAGEELTKSRLPN
jgi:hypothetical protein